MRVCLLMLLAVLGGCASMEAEHKSLCSFRGHAWDAPVTVGMTKDEVGCALRNYYWTGWSHTTMSSAYGERRVYRFVNESIHVDSSYTVTAVFNYE